MKLAEYKPRSVAGSKGAQERAARKYRITKLRRKELVVPVMETAAVKVGSITFPVRLPKVAMNAHGVLEAVVNRHTYETCTLVRA
jgi:hypothetical protein